MSSLGRPGSLFAIAVSLAIHVAGAVWFALRPPMFTPARPPAPIEVMLVPARPLLPPVEAGGGGRPAAPPEEKLASAAPPVTAPRPTRPRAARPRPVAPVAAPVLPRARAVEPGPAVAEPVGADDLAPGAVADADIGIGGGEPGGSGGSGGGTGGGVGTGTGTGFGPGRGIVEVKPRELRRPSLAEMRALYPEAARRDGIQAKVRLQLLVDTAGRVADVRVVRPAGRGFDEAAVSLARRFLFEPGKRDGRPAAMWITLTYSFEIEG